MDRYTFSNNNAMCTPYTTHLRICSGSLNFKLTKHIEFLKCIGTLVSEQSVLNKCIKTVIMINCRCKGGIMLLSKNLEHLELEIVYNKPIKLGKRIKILVSKSDTSHDHHMVLPKNLKHFHCTSRNLKFTLPKYLVHLDVKKYVQLSHKFLNCAYLEYYNDINPIIEYPIRKLRILTKNYFILDNIPNGIKNIEINYVWGGKCSSDNAPSKSNVLTDLSCW